MSSDSRQISHTIPAWLYSIVAACFLTLALLLLLAFAHRKPIPSLPVSNSIGIRLETINPQEESSTQATRSAAPNLASLLSPVKLATVSPIEIQKPSVDVSVDLSEMLEWRYSYADMGSSSAQTGSFGVSHFADVDGAVQNIVIPPKLFPDELIDAGITEGRTMVKLLIDEKGHVTVQAVLSSTHPSFVPIVVEAMNRSVYSIPVRDGRPTKVIIYRAVIFNADPQHVAARRASSQL